MFIDLANIIDAKKTAIINIIEVHRLSSPSIPSKRNVAAVPAPTASTTLSQNKKLSFRVRSDISAGVSFGTLPGVFVDSVGGVGVVAASLSVLSGTESGFLCLTNGMYHALSDSFKTLGVAQAVTCLGQLFD